VDIPRNPRRPNREAVIKARQDAAGRFGFVLGCVASLAAVAINLYRVGRPADFLSLATAVLMAALNMPLGIGLGLLGEKVTRPKDLREP